MRCSLVLVSQPLSISDTEPELAEPEVVTQALRIGVQMLQAAVGTWSSKCLGYRPTASGLNPQPWSAVLDS